MPQLHRPPGRPGRARPRPGPGHPRPVGRQHPGLGVRRARRRRDGPVLGLSSRKFVVGPPKPPRPAQCAHHRPAPGQPGQLHRALLRTGQGPVRPSAHGRMGRALLAGGHGLRHHAVPPGADRGRAGRPVLLPPQARRASARRARRPRRLGAPRGDRRRLAEPRRPTVDVGLPAPQGLSPRWCTGERGAGDEPVPRAERLGQAARA